MLELVLTSSSLSRLHMIKSCVMFIDFVNKGVGG